MGGTRSRQDKNNRAAFKPGDLGFTDRLAVTRAHLEQLKGQYPATVPELLPDTLEELSVTMEELRVADEELRVQHEELLATRLRIEEERQRYHNLFNFAPDGYLVTDQHGLILDINQAAVQLFNRKQEYLIKKPLMVLIEPDDRIAFRTWLTNALKSQGVSSWEGRVLSRGKEQPIDVSIQMAVMRPASGKSHDILWQLRDISELKQRNQQLELLGKQLLEVQELERRALSRNLHDEIGQLLTGLKMMVASNQTEEALQVLDGLVEQVREMSLQLRPAMLDDLGLLPTLVWHFERYTRQTNITVIFNSKGFESRLAPDLETAIYRITQESLTNVARHAKTKEVCVELIIHGKTLHLTIADHGIGFDVDKSMTNSAGLRGMKERTALLGGELRITSSPESGCQIQATIPIKG